MKLSVDFGRWTATKATAAIAGALVIAGAVGSAVAFSPTIVPPIKWQGGAEFQIASEFGFVKLYTVPAGRNFLLTDLTASNNTTGTKTFSIYSGKDGSCTAGPNLVLRMENLIVPPLNNIVLAYQTGIGFGANQAVCVVQSSGMNYNGRGFLFTPS